MLVAIGVDSIGTGLFAPLSLLFFVRVADLPLLTVGLLTSIGTVLSLPVPFIAGWLADRVGAKRVVIAGQAIQALGFVGYVFARESAAVLAAVAIVAIGQRLFWSTFFTMVADSADADDDPRAGDRLFAKVGMTQAAGLGLGALIAGIGIAAAADHVFIAIVIGNVVSFTLSGVLLLLVPAHRRAESARHGRSTGWALGYRALLRDRPYLGYILANIPFAICSVFLGVAIPVYVVDGLQGPGWLVGVVLAVNTVLLSVGQLAATRILRRLSRTGALAIAGSLWIVWSALTALAMQVPPTAMPFYLIGTILLYAAAEVVHAPISNALASAAAPAEYRGSYLAVFQYGFTVATLVVPAGFAWLFTADPAYPWVAIGALCLLSTLGMLGVGRRLPPGAVQPTPAADGASTDEESLAR